MLEITKSVKPEFSDEEGLPGPRESLVFFDIETTGLKASRSSLYLIGLLFFEGEEWIFKQFFAEDMYDEPLLLDAFFGIINKKRASSANTILIHYNGDMFDIPFIKNCVKSYRLPYDFSAVISLDMYRKIKPLKAFLGLPDCKLKSVEKFLGRYREDKYSGGELIYVYEDFLRRRQHGEDTGEQEELLLLHNEEDIMNMPLVLSMLAYSELFSGDLRLVSQEIVDLNSPGFRSGKEVLDLNYALPAKLPRDLDFCLGPFNMALSEKRMNLAADMREGELKYFLSDYKNYYYLTFEDYAVHKSIGEFVDRKARKQATARTCYLKSSGLFFPQPKEIFTPGFYEEYKSKDIYAKYDGNVFKDLTKASEYAHAVLEAVLKSSGKKDS